MSRAPNHPIAASGGYYFPSLGKTYTQREIVPFTTIRLVDDPRTEEFCVFHFDTCVTHIALQLTEDTKTWLAQHTADQLIDREFRIYSEVIGASLRDSEPPITCARLSLCALLNEQPFELPMQLGFICDKDAMWFTAAGVPGLQVRVEGMQMEYRR